MVRDLGTDSTAIRRATFRLGYRVGRRRHAASAVALAHWDTAANEMFVLTAAHCLHGGAGGRFFDEFTLTGADYDVAVTRSWTPLSVHVPTRWAAASDLAYDVGVCRWRVDDAAPSGLLPEFEAEPVTVVELAGYQNSLFRRRRRGFCHAHGVSSPETRHGRRVRALASPHTGGMTGGPWVRRCDGDLRVVAVTGLEHRTSPGRLFAALWHDDIRRFVSDPTTDAVSKNLCAHCA